MLLYPQPQGLGTAQEIPLRRDSSPLQSTIPQEQRWPPAYSPRGDHVVGSGEGVFGPRAMFVQSPDFRFVAQPGPRGPDDIVFLRPSGSQRGKMPEREAIQQSEQHWLTANRLMYVGKWVALSGNRLLAVGSNASEVYAKARALDVAVPFVAYIDPDDHLPFAGW